MPGIDRNICASLVTRDFILVYADLRMVSIYVWDECISSVILIRHMYDTNMVQEDGGGFKLDQERCHREPLVMTSPGLVSDHEVLS